MRHILFLDFDGVLHPFPVSADASQLFSNLPRLEAVLRDFPQWQIVISSAWHECHPLAELAALFSPDIRDRIIGVLPVIEIRSLADAEAVRCREIELLLAGEPAHWIALDDDPAPFPNRCPHLIQCINGFGAAEDAKLRQAMQQFKDVASIADLERMTPAEEQRFWVAFEASVANDDGQAAKSHLAAGRPIYYCEDRYPDDMIREWPDGRRELVAVDHEGNVAVIRALKKRRHP